MNTWLSWRSSGNLARTVRAVLRRCTRLSSTLLSLVGALAVLTALVLWWQPTLRGTFAAKVMPFVIAAVQNGPARLLSGRPLPPFAPQSQPVGDGVTASLGPAASANASSGGPLDIGYDDVATAAGNDVATAAGNDASSVNDLDPRTVPSVSTLASLIPSERVASDARDDRALVSAREQAMVGTYLARRYRVAQEPVGDLVKAAFDTGREVGLDPLLLLAVMAIESGFNPYAESGVGAKGLMQVMSTVHSDKFDYFGGQTAALQPLANIKVGALVLKDCIARGGSVAGGLRLYVGSTSPNDGGYGAKVIAERARLRDVARGRKVPINAPQAPVLASTSVSSTKRVQASLDGAHPIVAQKQPAATDNHAPAQDDASAAPKHAQQAAAEMGA
jgi:hypothetical protein